MLSPIRTEKPMIAPLAHADMPWKRRPVTASSNPPAIPVIAANTAIRTQRRISCGHTRRAVSPIVALASG
jgi:hypothetical protein